MRHLICALALAVYAPLSAAAQTAGDKNPLDYSLKEYGIALAVALLGGFVSWMSKVRAGHLPAWGLMQLVGELATSAFSGLLAFWVCEFMGTPKLMTITMVGIFGHMGTRGIALFEAWAEKRWGLKLNETEKPTP